MTNVLILGANGQVARFAIDLFLQTTDVHLTLFLRNAKRLTVSDQNYRVRIVEGNVLDGKALETAMQGQDVVYANLAGNLEQQAKNIVAAMSKVGLKRLIFISSMGVYNEVPGESHGSILDPYRKATDIIEASDLDYTILRPAWLNDRNEIAYGTSQKGESFKSPSEVVSRKSVADLVLKIATIPGLGHRASLGVHKA